MAETKTLSLLEALGKKKHEIEIDGRKWPFYELAAEEVGTLIDLIEKAAKAGVSVIDFLDVNTGKTEHLLKEDNWFAMAGEARHFFFHLVGYSLQISPEDAAKISVRHYPIIIERAYEVSGDFFAGCASLITGIIGRVPALAGALEVVGDLKLGSRLSPRSNEATDNQLPKSPDGPSVS